MSTPLHPLNSLNIDIKIGIRELLKFNSDRFELEQYHTSQAELEISQVSESDLCICLQFSKKKSALESIKWFNQKDTGTLFW